MGDVDGLLDSITRFQAVRAAIEPKPHPRRFAEQKVAFAGEIEKRCATIKLSKSKYQALIDIDTSAATSYRIQAELDLAKLKRSEAGPATK